MLDNVAITIHFPNVSRKGKNILHTVYLHDLDFSFLCLPCLLWWQTVPLQQSRAPDYVNEIRHRVCSLPMSQMPSFLKECRRNRWITGHRAHLLQTQTETLFFYLIHFRRCLKISTGFSHVLQVYDADKVMMQQPWTSWSALVHLMFLRHTSKDAVLATAIT